MRSLKQKVKSPKSQRQKAKSVSRKSYGFIMGRRVGLFPSAAYALACHFCLLTLGTSASALVKNHVVDQLDVGVVLILAGGLDRGQLHLHPGRNRGVEDGVVARGGVEADKGFALAFGQADLFDAKAPGAHDHIVRRDIDFFPFIQFGGGGGRALAALRIELVDTERGKAEGQRADEDAFDVFHRACLVGVEVGLVEELHVLFVKGVARADAALRDGERVPACAGNDVEHRHLALLRVQPQQLALGDEEDVAAPAALQELVQLGIDGAQVGRGGRLVRDDHGAVGRIDPVAHRNGHQDAGPEQAGQDENARVFHAPDCHVNRRLGQATMPPRLLTARKMLLPLKRRQLFSRSM